MDKVQKIAKKAGIVLAAPVLVYLFFLVLTNLTGHAGFGVGNDLRTILYNMIYSGFIALAVSYNLTSGRFDFSVGSVLILSLVLGGNLANQWELGPVGLLVMVVLTGMVCGLLSGVVYVTLRLPPMVTSLGVAMVFEAIGFSLNDSQGLHLIGRFDILVWSQPLRSVLLIGAVLALLIYILNYTQFGYNCQSLRTGQKNAVEVGVNEKKNAVLCYVIAGGLMGCAGIMYICQYGIITPQTGLGSTSFMMGAFLPMFIGNALSPYVDRNIGVMAGAFCQACLTSGVVTMGATSAAKTVIDGTVGLLFLVYMSNSYKIGLHRSWRQKRARAEAALGGARN